MAAFVFAVCGAASHIHTVNYALQSLRRFTRNRIIVVTDLTRNDAPVIHDNIIDVRTPAEFTHHQASIFLKTSLHRIVDMTEDYCYLDSDVIALNDGVDEIFRYKSGPVTFAPDHNDIGSFSPFAVNCGCTEKHMELVNRLEQLIRKHNKYADVTGIQKNFRSRALIRYTHKTRRNPMSLAIFLLRYNGGKLFSGRRFHMGGGFFYDPVSRTWQDTEGNVLSYHAHNYSGEIRKESGFHYSSMKQQWMDESGRSVYKLGCDHLLQSIREKFGISITGCKWTHFNGGVFLFNKDSADFMEAWHRKTMEIFFDPHWKVRDQGTLAATTWEFGLQHQPRLPQEFNFLADFNNPFIAYHPDKGFTKDNFASEIKPRFIHVYHKFGNKDWDVWQGIENIVGELS